MTTTTTTTTEETAKLEPGSYMNGSLRDEDIVGMFDTIATVTDCGWLRGELGQVEDLFDDANRGLFVGDQIDESIGYMFDHVGEHHCPVGFFFGSAEGDGAAFGVWADDDEDDTTTQEGFTK